MSSSTNVESIAQVTSTDVQRNTVHADHVQVSSAISHDAKNTVALNIGSEKLSQLMDRLSTTHAQLDDYTQRRTHQISIETQNIINRILEETKAKQRALLLEAQTRAEAYQEEYQSNLERKINEFNEEKAQQLALLEKSLNEQQEAILINARAQIDQLQTDANQVRSFVFPPVLAHRLLVLLQRKMEILHEAQQVANARLEQITEQVVHIGQEDSANRLASSTTTVITTQAVAQGHIDEVHATQGQTYAQVTAKVSQ